MERGNKRVPIRPIREDPQEQEHAATLGARSRSNRRRKENLPARQFIDRIIEDTSNAILTFDLQGRIRRANRKASEITGYSLDELIDAPIAILFSLRVPPQTDDELMHICLNGRVISRQEREIMRKDGESRSIIFHATPYYEGESIAGVVGTFEDSTRHKQAEEALAVKNMYLNDILNNATEFAVAATDMEFRIIYYNPKAEELFGYTAEEVIGKIVQEMHTKEKVDPKRFEKAVANVREHGEHRYQVKQKLENGVRHLESRVAGINNSAGELIGFALFSLDVTSRQLMEEQIRTSLAEKEVLLREIHHRVKNNLQLVMSLLELEADKASEQTVKMALNESRSRIHSMSLVHEQLYQSSDLANIDFSRYLSKLAQNLWRTYIVGSRQIAMTMQLDDVQLGINQAIPLGLLCNELITNIFEHAFPADKPGSVQLSLRLDNEGMLQLTIADNGIGIPDTVDWPKPDSMGLDLVSGLAKQLHADITLDSGPGTCFRIRFRRNGYG